MELIDKSAIVAEIDRIQESTIDIHRNFPSSYDEGKFDALTLIENFINTLEVKDVDLKQEINKYIQDNIIGFCVPGTEETAKHFFELGLKAQKGE